MNKKHISLVKNNKKENTRVIRSLEFTLSFSETKVVTIFKINSYFKRKGTFDIIFRHL